MKISARNQLQGTVKEITTGATTSHIKIEVGHHMITSAITNEAVLDLGLKVGDQVTAIIKASDVLVGK